MINDKSRVNFPSVQKDVKQNSQERKVPLLRKCVSVIYACISRLKVGRWLNQTRYIQPVQSNMYIHTERSIILQRQDEIGVCEFTRDVFPVRHKYVKTLLSKNISYMKVHCTSTQCSVPPTLT